MLKTIVTTIRINMYKLLTILLLAVIFTGCERTPEELKAKQTFIDKYGAQNVYVCNESGFLENRYFTYAFGESRGLQKNDANQPIRCNVADVAIQVKETVATGALFGSVN